LDPAGQGADRKSAKKGSWHGSGLQSATYEHKLKELDLSDNIGGEKAPGGHATGLQDPDRQRQCSEWKLVQESRGWDSENQAGSWANKCSEAES
jgi:hypothetical protein